MSDPDYFGVRGCGCVTAWMSAEHSSDDDVHKFCDSMAATGRAVVRAYLDGPGGWREKVCMCNCCQETA